tara:strand:+ start:11361 stop:21728 length:10368 start_codon:yes stop_codon:yes gene_type:complete
MSGYVILNTRGTVVDNSTRDPLALPKKSEGVVIWGPTINNKLVFDPTAEGAEFKKVNRAGTLGLALDPVQIADNHHAIHGIDVNNKNHFSLPENFNVPDGSFLSNIRNAKRMPLMNLRHRRFDYSNLNKFTGHVLKTYAAYLGLESIKETEEKFAEQLSDWTKNTPTPADAKLDRTEAYEDMMEYTLSNPNVSHENFFDNTTRFGEPILSGGTEWYQGEMGDVFSAALWKKNEFVMEEYGPEGYGFSPEDPERFIAIGGPENFDENYFDTLAGRLNEENLGADYKSLSLSNEAWNWQNFMKDGDPKPEFPNYIDTMQKGLAGFLIAQLCGIGIGTLAGIFGGLRNKDGRGSGTVVGLTTTSGLIKHASPFLAHRMGQGAMMTWTKSVLQGYDGYTNAKTLWKGIGVAVGKVKEGVKNLLGLSKEQFKSNVDDWQGSSIVYGVKLLEDRTKLPSVTLGASVSFEIPQHDNKDLYTPTKIAEGRVTDIDSDGRPLRVSMANVGDGYLQKIKITSNKQGKRLTSLKDGTPIAKIGTTKIGDAVLLNEFALLERQFYKTAVHGLYENIKGIETSISDFISVFDKNWQKANAKLNPLVIRAQSQGNKIHCGIDFSKNINYNRGDIIFTHASAAGQPYTSGNDTEHYIFYVDSPSSWDKTTGAITTARNPFVQGAPNDAFGKAFWEDPNTSSPTITDVVEKGSFQVCDEGPTIRTVGKYYLNQAGGKSLNRANNNEISQYIDWLKYIRMRARTEKVRISNCLNYTTDAFVVGMEGDTGKVKLDYVASKKLAASYVIKLTKEGEPVVIMVDNGLYTTNSNTEVKFGATEDDLAISQGKPFTTGGVTCYGKHNNYWYFYNSKYKLAFKVYEPKVIFGSPITGKLEVLGISTQNIAGNQSPSGYLQCEDVSVTWADEKRADGSMVYPSAWKQGGAQADKSPSNSPTTGPSTALYKYFQTMPVIRIVDTPDPLGTSVGFVKVNQKLTLASKPYNSNITMDDMRLDQINDKQQYAIVWQEVFNGFHTFLQRDLINLLENSRQNSIKVEAPVDKSGNPDGGPEVEWLKKNTGDLGASAAVDLTIQGYIITALKLNGLVEGDVKKLQNFYRYDAVFGLCGSGKIEGVSKDLAKTFYSDARAFAVHQQENTLLESLCGKKSCGAVHAYATVPPIGSAKIPYRQVVRDEGKGTVNLGATAGQLTVKNRDHSPFINENGEGETLQWSNYYTPGTKITVRDDGQPAQGTQGASFNATITSFSGTIIYFSIDKVNYGSGTVEYPNDYAWDILFWQSSTNSNYKTVMVEPQTNNAPIDICGNAEITLKFLPTWASEMIVTNRASSITQKYTKLSMESQQLVGRLTISFEDNNPKRSTATTTNKEYVVKDGNMVRVPTFDFPVLESIGAAIANSADAKTVAWSLADISLPPVIGNYHRFNKTWVQKAFGALRVPALLGGDVVANTAGALAAFLGGVNTEPNMAILYKEKKGIEGGIGGWILNKFRKGNEQPKFDEADRYIVAVRVAYEAQRVSQLGWMPYAERIVSPAATHDNMAAFPYGAKSGNSVYHAMHSSSLTEFYKQHALNIFKGFYRDLKTLNKPQETNIHPTRDQKVTRLQGDAYEVAGADSIVYVDDDDSTNDYKPLDSNNLDPLVATQKLSGICFPVVKSSGLDWKTFVVGVSGKMSLQPSGQQRETRLGFGGTHSIWNDNTVPSAITTYNSELASAGHHTNKHGWDTKTANAVREKLGLIEKDANGNYKSTNPIGADNNIWAGGLNYLDRVKEYQDISFYKEDRRQSNIKQIDDLYYRAERIDNPVKDGAGNLVNEHKNPCLNDGYLALGFKNEAECEACNWEVLAGSEKWGRQAATRAGGPLRESYQGSTNEDLASNWAEKGKGEIPVNSVTETFPGNGEWEDLGNELDERIGKFAPVFSKIYIDDLGVIVQRRADDNPKFLVGSNSTTERWSDDYGNNEPKAVVDFHRFYDKYVYHDWKTTQNNITQHNWEKNNNYWSAWHAAYEEGIKGAYIISGTGYNSAEALASMSGQLEMYGELVNKFHFTGEAPSLGQEVDVKRILTNKASEDTKKSFIGTGIASSEAEAYQRAHDHLNKVLLDWVDANYNDTEKQQLCDTAGACTPNPCLYVRSGYVGEELIHGATLQGTKSHEMIQLQPTNPANTKCDYQITDGSCNWDPQTPWTGTRIDGSANVCVTRELIGYDSNNTVYVYAMGCQDTDDATTKSAAAAALKTKIEEEENHHCQDSDYGYGWLEGSDKINSNGSAQSWKNGVFGDYDSTTISQDQTKYPHWVDGVNWYDWLTRAGQGGKNFTTLYPEYANSTATYIEITGSNLTAQDFRDKAGLLWNLYTINQGYQWAYGNNNQGNAHGGSCTIPSTGVMEGPYQSLVAGFGFVIGGYASSQGYDEHSYFRGFSDGPSTNSWSDLMSASMNSEPSPGTDFHDFFRDYVTDSDGQGLAGCSNFVYDNPDGSYSATWIPVSDIDHDEFGNLAGTTDNERSESVRSWGQGSLSYWGAQYDDVEVDYGWRVDEFGTKLKAKYRGYGFTGCPCEDFVTNWAATARAEAFETLHYWLKNEQGDTNPVKSFLGSDDCAEKYDENHARFEATWENEIADGLVDSSTFGSVIQKPSCLHGGYDDGDGDDEISSPYQHSNIGMSDFPSYYNQMSPNPGNNCGHTEAGDHDCALTALCGAGANNLGNNPEQNIYFVGPDAQGATNAGHYGSHPALPENPMKMWPIDNTANFKDLPNGYKCYSRSISEVRSLQKKDGTSVNKTLNLKEIIVSGSAVDPNGTTRYGIIAHEFWGTLTTPGSVDDNTTYDYVRIPVNNADGWLAAAAGDKPAVNPNVFKATLSGDVYCNYAHHYATSKLYSQKFSGVLYASGVVPFVTGITDWTSKGHVVMGYGEDPKTTPVVSSFDQDYLVDYDDGVKGIETFVPRPDKPNVNVPSRVVEGLEAARTAGANSTVINQAAKSNPEFEKGQTKLIVGYNQENEASGRGASKPKGDTVGEHWGVANDSAEAYARAGGDKVFIGGWPLYNQALDADVVGPAFEKQSNYGRKLDDAFVGKKVIIYDDSAAVRSIKKPVGGVKGVVTTTVKSGATSGAKKSDYTVKIGGVTYSKNQIHRVFSNKDKYLEFIQKTQVTQNVSILDYNVISASNEDGWTLVNKNKTYFNGMYTLIEANVAACPHCLPTEIKRGELGEVRKVDGTSKFLYTDEQRKSFGAPDYQGKQGKTAMAEGMLFGESYLVGQKVKWDIYSGNYNFAVPFRGHSAVVAHPYQGQHGVGAQTMLDMKHWREGVTPPAGESVYDERLSRTQYALATNTYNHQYPSTLVCEGYAEGVNNKLMNFTFVNDRQWVEIPSGGLMEIANWPMRSQPVWAGPKGAPICECRDSLGELKSTHQNKTDCENAGYNWNCTDWDNPKHHNWDGLKEYQKEIAADSNKANNINFFTDNQNGDAINVSDKMYSPPSP